MKQTRFWLVIIAVLLCSISARAHDFEVDGIRYDITSFTDLTVRATSISDVLTGELVVPSKVQFNGKELSVIEVGDDFANSNLSISSLAVNEGVISIGTRAFRDCANLKTIDIAHTVTQIGTECFYGCTSLEAFDNRGIVSLGSKSFAECGNLKEVSIENLASLTEGTFLNCTKLSDCNLPNITSIGKEAFKNCQSMAEYNITNDVESIGESAFEGCYSLTDIIITNSVNSIKSYAFKDCQSLSSIIIPDNVKELGLAVFSGCTSLTYISIGTGIKYLPWIFEGCTSLSDIRIEDSAATLTFGYSGEYNPSVPHGNNETLQPSSAMFVGFNLNNVYIGRNITTEKYCYRTYYKTEYGNKYDYNDFYVPNPPFSGSNIKSIVIGALVSDLKMCGYVNYRTSVGAFENCINLDSVVIKSTTTEIPQNTFSGCCKIESLEIPNTVAKIGSNAFLGCAGLKKLSLGSNLTTIGDNAFDGCDSLMEINLKNPNPPTYNTNFSSKLYIKTKVNVPRGYLEKYQETEPWRNFWNTSELNDLFFEEDYIKYSVVNNNEVEIIGNSFSEPTELYVKNKVEHGGNKYNVVSISNAAFKDCSYLLSVQIEDGITYIGNNAFYACNNLKMIIVPQSITCIGEYAFYGCKGLKELILEDGKNPLLIIPEKATYEDGYGSKTINGRETHFTIYYYSSSFSNHSIEKLYIGRNLSKESRYDVGEKRFYSNSRTDSYYHYRIYSYDAPFSNLSKLKELTIGENVEVLGPDEEYIPEVDLYVTPGSFKNCSSIQTVEVKSPIPPTGAEFTSSVYSNASLIVPKGAENEYQEATGWKNFVILIIATDSIVLDQQTITINVYDEHQLHATVYPENATDTTVIWTSSDETVVKVSNSGRITGVSAGKATITAACGNVSASCEVEVVIVEPNEIILNKQAIMTTVNSVYQLHATVYPEDVTDKTVIWTSSDESVVKVTDTGHLTGVSVGKATITASCGNVSASCDVEVEVENFIKTQPTVENLLVELNTPEEGVKYQWYRLVEGIYSKEIVPTSSGEYAWTESNGVWTSGNNSERSQTFSVMTATVNVQVGDIISFDYTIPAGDGNSYSGSQWLGFTINGETKMQTFGGKNGGTSHYELVINDYIIDHWLNGDSTMTIGFECVRTNTERATVSNIKHTRPTGFYRGMVDEKIVGATTARLDDSLFVEGSVVYCVVTLPSGKTLKSDNVQTKNCDTGFKESVLDSANGYTIYTLNGIFVMRTMSKSDLNNLPKGIYIVNGKILLVK